MVTESAQRLEESKCHSSLQEGQERGPRELQASQPHLHTWEGDGLTISRHIKDRKILRCSQHGFTKGQSCLTNLINFYNEMTGLVGEVTAVDIVYLDLAFDAISHKILIENLLMYGLDKQTVKWIENRLNGQAQRVVISSTKSSWRPVTRGILQGSILSPVLFKIFINDVDDGSQFADDTKLGGVADTPDGHAVIWRDLNRLEKWADRNLTKIQRNSKLCNPRHIFINHFGVALLTQLYWNKFLSCE
ncbi:LOW QUALITY PROTEIN: hypothetical protein QYF61_003133, partial [Mycteria americana]